MRSAPDRFTLLSDPVHGFVSVSRSSLMPLIEAPELQRLRRIRQLGVGYLVFPGAEHSRFGHALGAMALMHEALGTLVEKGTRISPEEHTAACAAALLHDVGHGPFSHSLEHELIENFEHEAMSRAMLVVLGERLKGFPELTLAMFDGTYPRAFFNQLIASQLDMDRLDYLRRDSYYTGVVEGRVGVERIIKILRVDSRDGREQIVIEPKGVYAVESFLIARRLMYWQVYLHKAVLAADHLLRSVLRRARTCYREGDLESVTDTAPCLAYFLRHRVTGDRVGTDDEVRRQYASLDDADLLFSLKRWATGRDSILADLSRRFLDRRLFKVTYVEDPPDPAAWRHATAEYLVREGLASPSEAPSVADYYMAFDSARHDAYTSDRDPILVLGGDGSLTELTQAADSGAIASLSGRQVKHYVCHPKGVRP